MGWDGLSNNEILIASCKIHLFWFVFSLPWGLFCHVVWGSLPRLISINPTPPPPSERTQFTQQSTSLLHWRTSLSESDHCLHHHHHCPCYRFFDENLNVDVIFFTKMLTSLLNWTFFRRWSQTWRWLSWRRISLWLFSNRLPRKSLAA